MISTDVELAIARLRVGGLVAMPTETVYGLAADALDPAAVARIFEVKGRPTNHPLIVHVANADHLDRWAARIPAAAEQLATTCWPGPLTMLLPRRDGIGDDVAGGRPTIGLRVPSHPMAQALLERFETSTPSTSGASNLAKSWPNASSPNLKRTRHPRLTTIRPPTR